MQTRYEKQRNAAFNRAMRESRPVRKVSTKRNRLDTAICALLIVAVVALIAIGAIASATILKA
jgi:hypothetical protein